MIEHNEFFDVMDGLFPNLPLVDKYRYVDGLYAAYIDGKMLFPSKELFQTISTAYKILGIRINNVVFVDLCRPLAGEFIEELKNVRLTAWAMDVIENNRT